MLIGGGFFDAIGSRSGRLFRQAGISAFAGTSFEVLFGPSLPLHIFFDELVKSSIYN